MWVKAGPGCPRFTPSRAACATPPRCSTPPTAGPDLGAPYYAPPPARPWLDEVGAPLGKLRVGVITTAFNGVETHPDCLAAVEHAAGLCRDLGLEVEDAALEIPREVSNPLFNIIRPATLVAVEDRAAQLGRTPNPEDVEPITWQMISGDMPSGADYIRATRAVHAIGRIVAGFFQDYDLMLSPTMASPPFPLGHLNLDRDDMQAQGRDVQQTVGYTSTFNASGNPAAFRPALVERRRAADRRAIRRPLRRRSGA